MTDKPHMTLPNGDKLYEGDYGLNRDGRKVGPMKLHSHNALYNWMCGERLTYTPLGRYQISENCHSRDIIAKWTEAPAQPEAPKLWRDMTPEEKGPIAIELVSVSGKVQEFANGQWKAFPHMARARPSPNYAYRIRPEPKRETVAICYRAPHGQWREIGTIDLIDGKPVIDSLKIEVGDV